MDIRGSKVVCSANTQQVLKVVASMPCPPPLSHARSPAPVSVHTYLLSACVGSVGLCCWMSSDEACSVCRVDHVHTCSTRAHSVSRPTVMRQPFHSLTRSQTRFLSLYLSLYRAKHAVISNGCYRFCRI
jgi:hypothetical protein